MSRTKWKLSIQARKKPNRQTKHRNLTFQEGIALLRNQQTKLATPQSESVCGISGLPCFCDSATLIQMRQTIR